MSGDPSPIRIMAVDDHPLLRQGIVGLGFSVRERNKIMSTDPSLIRTGAGLYLNNGSKSEYRVAKFHFR